MKSLDASQGIIFLYETGRAMANRVSAGGEAYDRHRMADA